MEAIIGQVNGAAYGTASIVHQNIHPPEIRQHLLCKTIAIFHAGNIHTVGIHLAAFLFNLLLGFFQLGGFAGGHNDHRTSLRQFNRRGLADTGRGAGHHHNLAGNTPFQGAINKQVGIQIALPKIPQPPGIGFQFRAFDV